MSKHGDFYTSVVGGEWAPEMRGCVDQKFYYQAALRMKNVEPVPQAGFRQLPGSRRMGPARRPLSEVAQGSPATDVGPHAAVATVYSATFAQAEISCVELSGFSATETGTLQVEVRDGGGAWVAVGQPFSVTDEARTRLAARAPGAALTATEVRVRFTPDASATVTLDAVSVWQETGTAATPRLVKLKIDRTTKYQFVIAPGIADIWREYQHVGAVRLPSVDVASLEVADFYAEADTVGIFAQDLESVRVRRFGGDHEWQRDLWPYESLPEVDLGGDYVKIVDTWQLQFQKTSDADYDDMQVQITVNGETIPAQDYPGGAGFPGLAAALQSALRDLPSLTDGVVCTYSAGVGMEIAFGGDLAGEEFEVTAVIPNSSQFSVLPAHVQIGKVEGEPLVSSERGWFATVDLANDRLVYAGAAARPGSIAASETGEYFNLNIEATSDRAATLDAIRTQTSETVRRVVESKYIIVFTDEDVYFVPNRTWSHNEPRNFVAISAPGLARGTDPVNIGGLLYYIGEEEDADGQTVNIVYSLQYSEVETSYVARPESLLASHLISSMVRTARQRATRENDVTRHWQLRSDGRLILAAIIVSEDVTGFVEWIAADAGLVKTIGEDGNNRIWLAVERDSGLQIEVMEEGLWFQCAVSRTADAGSVVSGLDHLEGRVVWAVADDYTEGPFTVSGGQIVLEDQPNADVTVGLWQPPLFESMPLYRVHGDNTIVQRPGRVHSAWINVIATTSIAVGANGEDPEDVPLATFADPADTPVPPKTELVEVVGMPGKADGPTLVITQTRPGALQVRDWTIGAKL